MNDERNFLYEQLLKVISTKQPDYFLLENVKGLENMQKGKVLSMILDDLEAAGTAQSKFFPGTKEGYRVTYNIFNALDYGVPQNRERIIILGVRKDLYENSPVSRYFDNSIAHRSRYDHRKTLNIPYTHSKSSDLKQDYSPLEIINLMYKDLLNNRPVSYPLKGDKIYSHTTLRDVIYDLPEDFDESITNHVGSFCKVNIKNTVGNRATDWNRHAPTIMGRGSGTGGPLIPPHPNKKRRLSVRETARIQTFPDNFTFHGSNSAAYRQIGNAVPVLFAYKIGEIFKTT
jgi:DNA (cytosine-5)-methyltransferase 1